MAFAINGGMSGGLSSDKVYPTPVAVVGNRQTAVEYTRCMLLDERLTLSSTLGLRMMTYGDASDVQR